MSKNPLDMSDTNDLLVLAKEKPAPFEGLTVGLANYIQKKEDDRAFAAIGEFLEKENTDIIGTTVHVDD